MFMRNAKLIEQRLEELIKRRNQIIVGKRGFRLRSGIPYLDGWIDALKWVLSNEETETT